MSNKVHFLKLKGSDHFIIYDGSMKDDEIPNGYSISITSNINYASRFSGYEAHNNHLIKEGICEHVFIDKKKTNIDPKYIQLSIFDNFDRV